MVGIFTKTFAFSESCRHGRTFSGMSQVLLVHPLQMFRVPAQPIISKCVVFTDNPSLTASPYTVRSQVSVADFTEFVSALEGKAVKITNDNFRGLSALCAEFRFADLAASLSEFRDVDDLQDVETMEDSEARRRLLALEEQMQQRDHEIVSLQCQLLRQSQAPESAAKAVLARLSRLEAEVLALRGAPVPAQAKPPAAMPSGALAQNPSATSALAMPPSGSVPPPSRWNSAIVPDLPKLFEDFKEKQFALLWRGGRDGFGKRDFHSRCDGHPNTLTVILDTDGNIFGGFTPVEWESWVLTGIGMNCYKADPSLKSFVFTLKNPHNIPARRFGLKAEKRNEAIRCNCEYGPNFWDIGVSDNCNGNTNSWTFQFGESYTNDTGLNGETFFTGSRNFQVKEIEIFEITN
jgi:hypothetical protein